MDERQLLKDCIGGDSKAQKRLYDAFAPKMYGVCLRYASDRDTAQDYLQEAFIRVFDHLDRFRFEGSLEGWIRKVVVNTALEKIRKVDVFKNSTGLENVSQTNYDVVHLEDQINATELLHLIQTLPTGFRTVFNLYAIEGYTHQEIATMLNINEGTSKSQYSRARHWLKDRLEKNAIRDGRAERSN
ncbi:MAG: RNA polymerase [Bacteroidetes bacterium HGW-Bacteroidetes-1]|jgi:RNA polymerase sigma-70 factor (ECF subfamily)|nr:MAG: RNA polymerase [Bacteroidetes bacterium HGW-Bacteroidetes-1]